MLNHVLAFFEFIQFENVDIKKEMILKFFLID